MTDPQWMYDNLKDDLALQMALYAAGEIQDIDFDKLQKLAGFVDYKVNISKAKDKRKEVKELLNKYAFQATEYILDKARKFAEENNKKLMVILFDPSVTVSLIKTSTRFDQEIVDYLNVKGFNFFDMNVVHQEDYKSFNLSVTDYLKRYLIGHYSPAGNHFFAYSIKPKIVDWLDPKPITYQNQQQQMINFKGYLNDDK